MVSVNAGYSWRRSHKQPPKLRAGTATRRVHDARAEAHRAAGEVAANGTGFDESYSRGVTIATSPCGPRVLCQPRP